MDGLPQVTTDCQVESLSSPPLFHTSWGSIFRSVEWAIEWGRARQNLEGVQAIGIDRNRLEKGHRYLMRVYPIDSHRQRLLWVGRHRKAKALPGFFRWLGNKYSQHLAFVCSDRWQRYLKVIAKKAS